MSSAPLHYRCEQQDLLSKCMLTYLDGCPKKVASSRACLHSHEEIGSSQFSGSGFCGRCALLKGKAPWAFLKTRMCLNSACRDSGFTLHITILWDEPALVRLYSSKHYFYKTKLQSEPQRANRVGWGVPPFFVATVSGFLLGGPFTTGVISVKAPLL